MRDGEAESCDVLRRRPDPLRRDVIELRGIRRGDDEGAADSVARVAHGSILPERYLLPSRRGELRLPHRLSQCQREPRGALRHVLPEDEHGVRILGLTQRCGLDGPAPNERKLLSKELELGVGDPEVEAVAANESLEREVGLQRGARGADADHIARAQDRIELVDRFLLGDRLRAAVIAGKQWLADARRAIDEAIAIPPAIAQEIAVDLTVVT